MMMGCDAKSRGKIRPRSAPDLTDIVRVPQSQMDVRTEGRAADDEKHVIKVEHRERERERAWG